MEGEASAGWDVRQDEATGQVYYWNAITGETSWEPPPHFASRVALPWTTAFDENGQMYYLNVDTMETQWTPPSTTRMDGTDARDVLTMTGGRGRRPSTAEQMVELNRLLSGDMGDYEDPSETEGDGSSQVEARLDRVSGGGSVGDSSSSLSQATASQILGKTSTGDPCPWTMFVNAADSLPYYYNNATGECLWDPPEEFLRSNQQQQGQQESDGTTVELRESAKTSLAMAIEGSNTQDPTIPTIEISKPNSARPKCDSTQAVAMAEFEEKMNRAITAVLNNSVGSSNVSVVPVHTPSEQLVAPQSVLSADSEVSARTSEGSPRAFGGHSRPSSSGAVNRPRTPSVGAVLSRHLDDILPAQAENVMNKELCEDKTEEKKCGVHDDQTPRSGSKQTEIGVIIAPVTHPDDKVQPPADNVKDESTGSARGVFEETCVVTNHNDELELATLPVEEGSVSSADVIAEGIVPIQHETTGQNVKEATDKAKPITSTDDRIEEISTKVPVENKAVAVDAPESAARPDDAQLVGDSELLNEHTGVDVPLDVLPSIELEEETLEHEDSCTSQSLNSEGERGQASEPNPFIMEDSQAVEPIHPLGAKVKELSITFDEPNSVQYPSSGTQVMEKTASSSSVTTDFVRASSTPPMLDIDAQGTAPGDTLPKTSLSAVSSVRSCKNLKKHTPTQVQRQERASHFTRLPSVLDVAKYFPSRHNVFAPVRKGSIDNSAVPVAITRKKIESYSPYRVHHLSQRELEKMDAHHQQNLEARKTEEDRVQRAEILECQRIYGESRKAFKEEQQRILREKMERESQHEHDVEVEKHQRDAARFDAKQVRDDERARGKMVADGDALLWDLIETLNQPTSQRIHRFQNALNQLLDAAQFADKMCAERARELQQRINHLHRASCAIDSQLESLELQLLSELQPLTELQRPLQAKYAGKLRCRLERMLLMVQSWQAVLDEWDSSLDGCSSSRYWGTIQARYASYSLSCSSDESRRKLVLNDWRGGTGGDSLLHVAAWNGWDEHVRFLIDQGADVNLVDTSASHTTPLLAACRAGHVVVVQLLVHSGARLNVVDSSGDSALHIACRGGWTRVVRILLVTAGNLKAVTREAVHLACYEMPDMGKPTSVASDFTAAVFFNRRNGKGKRAIEVATLASLIEELELYDNQLINDAKMLRDKDVPVGHKQRKQVMVGSGYY